MLLYERGEITVPPEFIFKFGYSGSGTDFFHAYLGASGINVPKSELETAAEGTVLKKE